MNNRAFTDKKKILMNIKNTSEEETIQYYCDCLLKMYMAFDKIEETEMLSYIEAIMAPAFPLVVDCFKELVDEYMKSESEVEKKDILEDIERSVVEYGNVFETIIHSTNGAARMLLQTAPINIGLNYAAPKLCAYYSTLLNQLAKLFVSTESYFFCVYPRLSVTIESRILFMKKKRSGKVSVARVPAKDIAKVQHLRICLGHEFFHVLPREMRLRDKRSYLYFQILLYAIYDTLTNGVANLDDYETECLRGYLFEDLISEITEYGRSCKNSPRCFYSDSLRTYYANAFQRMIASIQRKTPEELFERVFAHRGYENYEEFAELMREAERIKQEIDVRADDILIMGNISDTCKYYMDIFREGFADLFFVLALRVKPQEYFNEFDFDKHESDEMYNRVLPYLRAYFVIKTLTSADLTNTDGAEDLFHEWRQWASSKEPFMTNLIKSVQIFEEELTENAETKNESKENDKTVIVNKPIIELYTEYFVECCNKYLNHEKKHEDDFVEFRKKFLINQQENTMDVLNHIAKRQWEDS